MVMVYYIFALKDGKLPYFSKTRPRALRFLKDRAIIGDTLFKNMVILFCESF